jgi:hypothetical protein
LASFFPLNPLHLPHQISLPTRIQRFPLGFCVSSHLRSPFASVFVLVVPAVCLLRSITHRQPKSPLRVRSEPPGQRCPAAPQPPCAHLPACLSPHCLSS